MLKPGMNIEQENAIWKSGFDRGFGVGALVSAAGTALVLIPVVIWFLTR
ncbi:MAG TPA: hypothetical protein VM680_18545 [Verrucomicrobiae bacterium]|nr:hypothetical protein [Verrucomicrobiae bacterium]